MGHNPYWDGYKDHALALLASNSPFVGEGSREPVNQEEKIAAFVHLSCYWEIAMRKEFDTREEVDTYIAQIKKMSLITKDNQSE